MQLKLHMVTIEDLVPQEHFLRKLEAALDQLGADIVLSGKTARVRGVAHLHGAMLRAEDLRGAAALITAGLLAEGESEVLGLSHLARGYENLEQNLKNLGAAIKSVDIPAPFVYNT